MEHDFVLALIGGICIGLGSLMLLFVAGKVAGVSGIVAGIFSKDVHDKKWRVFYLAGLLSAATVWMIVWPERYDADESFWLRAVIGGFLVGFGTRLANGCTSGHGVCGVGRFSKRSLTATCVFLATAILVVTGVRLVSGT